VPGAVGEAGAGLDHVTTAAGCFKREEQASGLGEAEYEGVLIVEADLAEKLAGGVASPEGKADEGVGTEPEALCQYHI